MPVALLDKKGGDDTPRSLDITYGNKTAELQLRFKNRFHYLPIKASEKINKLSIESNHELIAVGEPIYRDKALLESSTSISLSVNLN